MKPSFVLCVLLIILTLAGPVNAQTSYIFTKLDLLGSNVGGTAAISGSNAIVTYLDTDGNPASFFYSGGRYTLINDILLGKNTYATSISGSTVVGVVEVSLDAEYGFTYANGTFTTLTYPGASATNAMGLSGSKVVGVYRTLAKKHGYSYLNGVYTSIDFPSAHDTAVSGISGSNIVGSYTDTANVHHGFIYNGSTYTSISYPGALNSETAYVDGNNVIGIYQSSASGASITGRGFLYNGGTYTSILYPSSYDTLVAGISGNLIVGSYINSKPSPLGNFNTIPHGFIYNIASRTYTGLDVPGSRETSILSVSGTTIAGAYEDMNFIYHGFIAVPATRTLTVSGSLAFGGVPSNTTATQIMTIKNMGTAPVTISGISYPTGFSGSTVQPLAPGSSEQITVTFAPTTTASYSGNITITSNATTSPNTIAVSGMGSTPVSAIVMQPEAVALATPDSSAPTVTSEAAAVKAPVLAATSVMQVEAKGPNRDRLDLETLPHPMTSVRNRRQFLHPVLDTTTVPGSSYSTLIYRQDPDMASTLFHLEVSQDLKTWTAVTPDLNRRIGIDSGTGDYIIEVGIKTGATAQPYLRLTVGAF